jgi:transposase
LPRYQRRARPGKLDEYKHYLRERVEVAAPEWIPAAVLPRELRALGYRILKDHLASLRPVIEPQPRIRLETGPPDAM